MKKGIVIVVNKWDLIEKESSTAALKGSTEDEQFFDGTHH